MSRTASNPFARFVLAETLCITILCFVDMVWTIIAVHMGIAKESNPLMAGLLAQSTLLFASVKLASFLLPISILELLRASHPVFVAKSLRVALALYVALYVFGSLRAHGVF
jgi:hypothetical protein